MFLLGVGEDLGTDEGILLMVKVVVVGSTELSSIVARRKDRGFEVVGFSFFGIAIWRMVEFVETI